MRVSGFVRQLVVVPCAALLVSLGAASAAEAAGATGLPAIHHVFIIMLENKDNDVTFGPSSPAPYLAETLTAKGAYLQSYFGTGHVSLDNYIALISGQAPNLATQYDCQEYVEFASSGMTADAQAIGQGCVYPSSVHNLTDEMAVKGLTWRSYNEDMGNNPAREAGTCGHPQLGSPDGTQKAQAPSAAAPQGDQYATRHNPFLYFHSVIDSPDCATHVVNFRELSRDLAAYETTANLTFITPNLCDDGHDAPCVTRQPGGLVSANAWLSLWVPTILASPAYTRDGLLLILFDESEVEGKLVDGKLVMTGDATACCNEQSGPNTKLAGQIGPGGGHIGAVALSPFIKPGTVSHVPYNHYSTLKTIEDIFGLPHLGYSGASGLAAFGNDVFSQAQEGGSMQPNSITAIDIALEPDAIMIQHAEADNARLRTVNPQGFALDATHKPHITMLQRFVRTADLDKIYAGVDKVLAGTKPADWKLRAFKYYYIPSGNDGVAGIVIQPTEDLLALQQELLDVVAPYTTPTGTAAAFATTPAEPNIDPLLIDYVATFVPKGTGKNFNPHVTIGVASQDHLKKMLAEPFTEFTFSPAGISVYQLGDYGTARKKPKTWEFGR